MSQNKYDQFLDLKYNSRANKYIEIREAEIKEKIKKRLDFFYMFHGWLILFEIKAINEMSKEYSITPSNFRVLAAAYLKEKLNNCGFYANQLNELLNYKNKLSIHREIKVLLHLGLIEYGIRQRGRRQRYFVTYRGKKIIRDFSSYFNIIFLDIYNALTKSNYDPDLMRRNYDHADL